MAHPAGPFTSKCTIIDRAVFFWAPTFKWMITLSNISDMKRPAQLVSANQQCALAATGLVWVKYSFNVVPVNYNLAIVNFFMSFSALAQLFRKTQVPAELGGFWGPPPLATPNKDLKKTADK